MKIRMMFSGIAVLMLFLGTAAAADISGKWMAETQGMQGPMQTTFDFKVEGTKLTGNVSNTMGETPITDGKVEGDNVSFAVIRKFGENEMKIVYKGKIAGDEITFTREFQGGPGGPGGPGMGPGAGPGGGPGAGPGGGPGGGPGMGPGGPPAPIVAKRVK